jgi:kynurenine formamidase
VLSEDSQWMKKGDLVITPESLGSFDNINKYESLIIRTLPNNLTKIQQNYSATNPPYLLPEAMALIAKSGIQHLLIDLPSVDRESDEGRLTCHKIFWNYPEKIDLKKTITEIIYIPDSVVDGEYLLELQMAPFVNDASPSRPVIYQIAPLP